MARVRRLVTTRAGGASRPPYDGFNLGRSCGDDPVAVQANRAQLAGAIGLTPDRLVFMRQVHGAAVHVVQAAPATPPLGDGLVTSRPGLALVALAADCVPVLMADRSSGVVAVAHAGRRGAAAGIATATLQTMVDLGADPGRIDVLLGPAICGACYEVPADLQAEVAEALPGSATTTRQGTPGLDLRAGLARALAAAGVSAVVVDPACTAEDPRFYSYRRDGVTGRFAGVAWVE
ncbi:MAG: peptidoglycan editing factor PgeF [Actinomycetota bacterium]|nr:peptidoglycan editing factor PgeF [Actinomycetota bacterium]